MEIKPKPGQLCKFWKHTVSPHRHYCQCQKNKTLRCGWSLAHREDPRNCPLFVVARDAQSLDITGKADQKDDGNSQEGEPCVICGCECARNSVYHFHNKDQVVCLKCSGKTLLDWHHARARTPKEFIRPGSRNASWVNEFGPFPNLSLRGIKW